MNAPEPTLTEFAETPLGWVVPEPGGHVARGDRRFILHHSPVSGDPQFGAAMRVRLAGADPDRALSDVRHWFSALGRERSSWHIRPSANPPGTVDALLDLGLRPHPTEPTGYTAMYAENVPAGHPGVDVRRASCVEDHLAGVDILAEVFGLTHADAEAMRRTITLRASQPESGRIATYLAYLNGRPAARGTVCFTASGMGALYAGATLPFARRRGLHGALVRARFDEVRARGGTGLVVHAGSQSRSVFESLGFKTLDQIVVLFDFDG
jgi:GNAT superfamily N-acetyltransferase